MTTQSSPIITEMKVIPVAGHDSMLLNIGGAHNAWFTRNIVVLTDNAGHTGVGEAPGGEVIYQTLLAAIPQVVGVEGVPALVEKGRENAARNGLSNVTFFHENLEEDVTRQAWAKHGFDKVLLDPARAGAPGVMPHIIKLAPRRVVYVSCNPATLARDSETLLQAGYQIQRLAMLDMFPHTGHLESMVLFERRLT